MFITLLLNSTKVAPMLHQKVMEKIMATVNVILRKRPNKDGRHPLQFKITINKRSLRLNTGKIIEAKYWDSKLKAVKSSYPNYKHLNNFLRTKINEIELIILNLESKDSVVTLELIKSKLRNTNGETVFKKGEEFFEELKLARKFNRYSGEKAALSHFKRFRKNRDLSFEDLNVRVISQFKAYLTGEVGLSPRSVRNYLVTIRTIFNRAIAEGIVDQKYYPFGKGKVSLKKIESARIGLDIDEVLLFKRHALPQGSFLEHARRVWLFSFYFAGMRAGDVLTLKWSDFKNGRLFYTMEKNTKSDSIEIPEEASEILQFYTELEPNPHGLVFPDLSNVENMNDKMEVQRKLKYRIRKIDRALKKIQIDSGISKTITMHIARHTFGNIAGDKIPLQRLQQLYRHSSIETTLNYQKAFLYKGSDDALNHVLDLLKK